jgi:hypothetical protein
MKLPFQQGNIGTFVKTSLAILLIPVFFIVMPPLVLYEKVKERLHSKRCCDRCNEDYNWLQ